MSKLDKLQNYEWLYHQYWDRDMSFDIIAAELGTYPLKVWRAAKKMGIPSKERGDAQRAALKSGRLIHPTKGKKLSEKTKQKISENVSAAWTNKSEEDKEAFSKQSKKRWKKMSKIAKIEFQEAAHRAIRLTADIGSKLERGIKKGLEEMGHEVRFHVKNFLKNSLLEVDLYLPELSIVIEIDGPTHFLNIWGEDKLRKTIRADNEKNGLILQSGINIIRVKQLSKHTSQKHIRDALINIEEGINEILKKKRGKFGHLMEIEIN